MSQGTYKITEAQQGRTYTGKYGENTVWLVRLENAEAQSANGMFELHKKAGATIQPGQEIEVERFIEGEFDGSPFVRIKQVFNQSSGGGRQQLPGQVSGSAAVDRPAALAGDGFAVHRRDGGREGHEPVGPGGGGCVSVGDGEAVDRLVRGRRHGAASERRCAPEPARADQRRRRGSG